MTTNPDDMLNPAEVALWLRVSVSTLIRWRRESRKQGEKIGPSWVTLGHRTVLYRRGAVQEYLDSREQRADG